MPAVVSLIRTLTAASVGLLVLCPPAWSAGKEPASSPDASQAGSIVVAKAEALIKQRRYVEALTVLRALVAAGRDDGTVLFLTGLAAIGGAQKPGASEKSKNAFLDVAIAAFRRMLVRDPGLVRVRLELARAFFLKGEDTLARRHFERVLAGKPPAAVALNVNRFLTIMRARKRWSVRVGMALAPDSNIGARSKDRTILLDTPFGRLPFTFGEENARKSGVGISAWAGGEYQYPLGDSGTGSGASRWRLRAGADVSRKEYRGSRFDRLALSGHLGPRWLVGRYTDVSVLASARHEWVGSGIEDPSHHDLGLRVEGRHRLGPRTVLNAHLSRHERHHDETAHLDGPITDVTVGAGWVASPTVRVDASAGWGRVRTERERERNTSRRVTLGVSAALPLGFTVGGGGMLRWVDYEGDWWPFTEPGTDRRDLVRSLRVFAHNRAITVAGFSPQVSVVKEERTSTAQLHDYERIYGELRFVRLF